MNMKVAYTVDFFKVSLVGKIIMVTMTMALPYA